MIFFVDGHSKRGPNGGHMSWGIRVGFCGEMACTWHAHIGPAEGVDLVEV